MLEPILVVGWGCSLKVRNFDPWPNCSMGHGCSLGSKALDTPWQELEWAYIRSFTAHDATENTCGTAPGCHVWQKQSIWLLHGEKPDHRQVLSMKTEAGRDRCF